MDNEIVAGKIEVPAAWEAPTLTEYDAKAEIQGAGFGRNETGFFNS